MFKKEQKPKKNHVVIVTSDAVDANVKQYRIRPWILWVIILVLCVVIGALIGYFIHEEQIWEAAMARNQEQLEAMNQLENEKTVLENEKTELESQVAELNEQIEILSETVNQKVEIEKALTEQLEKQSLPTEFPLTGSASMEEVAEGEPMCVFVASVGTTVVSTASGIVLNVNNEEEYGHNVWIDHGNGYVSIYRNQGEPTVKLGDSVVQGTTLFIIGEDNTKLGYQMQKDGAYIDPMEMLAISG